MSVPVASLDMYCWPENRHAWEALWSAIHLELTVVGVEAPEKLTFDRPLWEVWQDPDLLIGHTCGWPYISKLRDQVRLIGRFDFNLEGCQPGHYNSLFIGRPGMESASFSRDLITSDLAAIAVNGLDSQSGFRVFREIMRAEPETAIAKDQIVISGSHRNSIIAVASGDADIAAVDGVTWQMAEQFEPAAKEVAILGCSKPIPGLPLVSSARNSQWISVIFRAINAALKRLDSQHRELLGIERLLAAQAGDYEMLVEGPH